MEENAYATLGLAWGARPGEVRRAFRKLALRWHPDRNPGDSTAEAQFKRINAAYQRLKAADFELPRPVDDSPFRPAPQPEEDEARPSRWPNGNPIHYPTPADIAASAAAASRPPRPRWRVLQVIDRLMVGVTYFYFGLAALGVLAVAMFIGFAILYALGLVRD